MTDEDANPLSFVEQELASLDAKGLRRTLANRVGPQGPRIEFGGKTLINFGSNDYLGLAADPRLAEAAIAAINLEGWGAGASPLITGRSETHRRLEQRLAQFEGTEAALLFNSGFAANAGVISALMDRGDAIFADEKNHASLIDGCRLSKAQIHVYPHLNVEALEQRMQGREARRRMIVTDSVFSMDGDLAPLAELAALAQRTRSILLVDEAHATGVFGRYGRGLAEQLGVEEQIPIRIGTLSKALGCSGGFVVGSRWLIDFLMNRVRSYVFSTAMPAANAAAALAALDIVRQTPHHRQELLARAEQLREQLRNQGWNLGRSSSQIIPLIVGDSQTAMRYSALLREQGLLVPGIRPPSVPAGQSLLRISLSHKHDQAMIDALLDGLAAVRGS